MLSTSAAAPIAPNILFIVGDDVGYNDIGAVNGGKTHTPNLDALIGSGINLKSYYTFKICSPSRAAMLTGRYPWGAGFYDMDADTNHCTTQFTALPQMLKQAGYRTHALGKWDVGFMKSECSPTGRGFDTFFGYYMACQADYWYHGASGGYPPQCQLAGGGLPTDFSNSSRAAGGIRPASAALNGTYNTHLLGEEAVRLVMAHDASAPMYMYLAFMAVHDGCGGPFGIAYGKQAPVGSVAQYSHTKLDTYKVAGAMYSEMDSQVGNLVGALRAKGMWPNTALVFVSDNGGPLDHATNHPLRGGKHTFFEGGVRVTAFVSGALVPAERRGTEWWGMAASADWYHTLTEGLAGSTVPAHTGPRPPDGFNLWPDILSGRDGPRAEVVHQVHNQYCCDRTFDTCSSSIRMGEMKLIVGNSGDSRTLAWPDLEPSSVRFGASGGFVENGTDHARAPGIAQRPVHDLACEVRLGPFGRRVSPRHVSRSCMAAAWRSRGGRMAVAWRSHGGRRRFHGGRMAPRLAACRRGHLGRAPQP